MKRVQLLWLLASVAGAVDSQIRATSAAIDYPGVRFGVDRKLSITIFSDLHFGERRLTSSKQLETKHG